VGLQGQTAARQQPCGNEAGTPLLAPEEIEDEREGSNLSREPVARARPPRTTWLRASQTEPQHGGEVEQAHDLASQQGGQRRHRAERQPQRQRAAVAVGVECGQRPGTGDQSQCIEGDPEQQRGALWGSWSRGNNSSAVWGG
jgi:hypothetical protein